MAVTASTASSAQSHGGASTPWATALWIVWLGLLVAGVYGLFLRLTYGHILAGYGSYVPWGLWIGLYFLGVGISGGAFAIGAVGYILGLSGFSKPQELRTAIVLSLSALIPAFVGVALDLGRTERLVTILIAPTFTSMMAFNAWMYNIFLVVAVISWLLSFSERSDWLKPLLVLGALLAILFPSQSGVFFEAVRTNAFWHSPILSVLFLASAFALGGAGLMFVRTLMGPDSGGLTARENFDHTMATLRTVAVAGIVMYAVFEFAEFSIAFWDPNVHSPNLEFLLFGDYWSVFWIFHILLGIVAPLGLFLSRSRGLWAVGSLLAMIGFAAARMSILVPGQIAGQLPGLQAAFQDARLTYTYHPTAMEYLVGCLMLAVGMALFFIGTRLGKTSQRVEQKS